MTFSDVLAALSSFSPALKGGAPETGFSAVCVDSRAALSGSLFVALPGERVNGHDFIQSAFDNGALCALAEEGKAPERIPAGKIIITVRAGALAAFQTLAASYLRKFPRLLRIGITGSSGKTTTKEIFALISAYEKKTVFNKGNLNSESGLPLSVFDVRCDDEAGVFEMGMNKKGEIAALARVLKPQIALITNIGSAHIGFIGSREGIAAEKKAIFSCFTGSETAIIPQNDDFSAFLSQNINGNVVFYNVESEIKRLDVKSAGLSGWDLTIDGKKIRFPLAGRHNLCNALAAITLARVCGFSSASVCSGLAAAKPLFGRSEIIQTESNLTVVRDCYNANPEALFEAVKFCDSVEWQGRRVYVIGSMLELGERSKEVHEKAGALLAASRADFVFLFGEETARALPVLQKSGKPVLHFTDIEALKNALAEHAPPGSLVLLKGSRLCALERVLE